MEPSGGWVRLDGAMDDVEVIGRPGEHFAELYRDRRDHLLRIAVLVSGDRQLAEDAVAEAVARTWRRWDRGGIGDPDAYLRRAVLNAVTDRVRRLGRERVGRQAMRGDARGARAFDDDVADRTTLIDALATLPDGQRAVLVLRYFDGQTEAATAALLGINVGTVKSRAFRGLAALAVHLAEPEATDV